MAIHHDMYELQRKQMFTTALIYQWLCLEDAIRYDLDDALIKAGFILTDDKEGYVLTSIES